jgi:hypothetical protein
MAQEPKKTTAPEESAESASMASVLAQLAQMQQDTVKVLAEMRQSGSADGGIVERLLQQQEQLLVKTRPENYEPTGISAYSYPEGNLKRPKPTLRCKTIWVGRELTGDTETPEEIELLNRLPAGDHFVTKANGQSIPFEVRHKLDANRKLAEVNIWFPTKGEHRGDHMSLISYCRQALGDAIPTVSQLEAEVLRLRAELEAARQGVMRAS